MRLLLGAGLLVAGLLVAPPMGQATLLPVTNFDTLTLGTQVGPPLTDAFMTPDLTSQGGSASHSIGTMVSNVYQNGNVYTYVIAATPLVAGATEVNTGFAIPGLLAAGWSFTQAVAAGAPSGSTAFTNLLTADARIDWIASTSALIAGLWNNSHLSAVTFFYQSTVAPGTGPYNLMTSEVGTDPGYAPVPEPGSLLLLGSGAIAAGAWLRRRVSRQRHAP